MHNWLQNVQDMKSTLDSLSVRDGYGREILGDKAFGQWKTYTSRIRKDGKTVYLIGNGASASMASHAAADLAKNACLRTEVFSDLSLITAIANDMSYEDVFAEPLRRRMSGGDMLVAISSSGESPNVICAAREATRLGGLVVTISAMGRDNTLRSLGTLNFHVPAMTYGMAETCHAAILHHWIDRMVESGVPQEYKRPVDRQGLDDPHPVSIV